MPEPVDTVRRHVNLRRSEDDAVRDLAHEQRRHHADQIGYLVGLGLDAHRKQTSRSTDTTPEPQLATSA